MVERFSVIGDPNLADYTDFEELGAAPSSIVYAASERATKRRVALRVLSVDPNAQGVLDVLDREVVGLGALWSHPNVVTLLRFLTTSEGKPVLVFEYCDTTAASRLRAAPFSPQDAISLGIKIAGALECAHREGILHRDVNPRSIFFTEFAEPALGDFGLARLGAVSQVTISAVDLQSTHTPPEILDGQPASARSDVYSLASTMYHLVAGRSPFQSTNDDSPAAVLMRILREEPPPLPPDVPGDLNLTLAAALAKDPSARPTSARDFADRLSQVEADQGWARTSSSVDTHDEDDRRTDDRLASAQVGPVPIVDPQWASRSEESITGGVELPDPTRPVAIQASVAPSVAPPEASDDAPVSCPNGHAVRSSARFCGVCGSAVTVASPPPPPPPPPPATDGGPGPALGLNGDPSPGVQPQVVCQSGHPALVGAEHKPFCRICGAPMLTECEAGHSMPSPSVVLPHMWRSPARRRGCTSDLSTWLTRSKIASGHGQTGKDVQPPRATFDRDAEASGEWA